MYQAKTRSRTLPRSKSLRRSLLTGATAVVLCLTVTEAGRAAAPTAAPSASPTAPVTRAAAEDPSARGAAPGPDPHDAVDRRATAPDSAAPALPAPGGLRDARVPGPRTPVPEAGKDKAAPRATVGGEAVPCTLDGVTGLSPERFADFLAADEVTADGCLRGLIWTWDQRLAPVMSRAHIQAVADRASGLSPGHDGTNGTHLLEMFTYLHAVAYHAFSHDEVDISGPATLAAMRRSVDAFGSAARTFDVTRSNAETLREALTAAGAEGLRQHQLPLVERVLATMDAAHPGTARDATWGGAVLAALTLNYLGVHPGNRDTAFHAAVAAAPAYRAAFKVFADHTHLKGTVNAWVVRDGLGEYGRMGQIDALRGEIVPALGPLLATTARNFGELSAPWAKVTTWLNAFDACAPHRVCRTDIEKRLFPRTDAYGARGANDLRVRSGLDRDTVDQLYYASAQVKAQFHRVLGTLAPLPGDTNSTLNVVLYASRAQYEDFQPLLTGLSTDNGGMYIEKGATFYTYQRRVPQDSSLTLEELFRHEYTHYLNGRWAVPGSFGAGHWYERDRTTAMDEGTAEFFDGATRDDGVKVRRSLVRSVIADTAGGGPRMSVEQILHATYDGDGFRFYAYAGTFFEFLWTERPALLKEMYRHLRADAPAAFDAWRHRLGTDAGIQRAYDVFLDEQIAQVDDLFVPDTAYTPLDRLDDTSAVQVRASFAATTGITPECAATGSQDRPRFVCVGRVTANLSDSGNADRVFADMSETVDHFVLDRAAKGGNNLTDMNCSFDEVDIWPNGRAGSSDIHCEGPLRR